jgi:hypothetical protein
MPIMRQRGYLRAGGGDKKPTKKQMRRIGNKVKNVKVAQKSLEAIQSEKRKLKARLENETLSDEEMETIHQQIDKLGMQERRMKKKYKKKRSAWDKYKNYIGAAVATAGVAYLAKDIDFHEKINSAVDRVKKSFNLENVWKSGKEMAKNVVCDKLPVTYGGFDVCTKVPGCKVLGERCVPDTYDAETAATYEKIKTQSDQKSKEQVDELLTEGREISNRNDKLLQRMRPQAEDGNITDKISKEFEQNLVRLKQIWSRLKQPFT